MTEQAANLEIRLEGLDKNTAEIQTYQLDIKPVISSSHKLKHSECLNNGV